MLHGQSSITTVKVHSSLPPLGHQIAAQQLIVAPTAQCPRRNSATEGMESQARGGQTRVGLKRAAQPIVVEGSARQGSTGQGVKGASNGQGRQEICEEKR